LIFAIGVAIGMAKKEKEVAALSAAIAYFVMHSAISAMITLTNYEESAIDGAITQACGITTLEMGVFGGIIVGLGVAALHNKFHKIELPNAISFFAGSRFVPIISTLVYTFVGILMFFIWPFIQNGIYALGGLVTGSGYVGTLIFGLIKRALIPFGLHHVFYMPFWQTAVGGTATVAGELYQGGQNIFFAQLAHSADIAHFSADATRYFSGEFIFMIFGLPGAALAMYRTARPEKKKAVGGLLLSAALASMFTGITEPIEFSFLFVAPILFGVQVILAGSAYMIAHMLNIAVGLTFSGGFIDLFLFGILQGNAKTSWLLIIPVGIIYFLLYYFIFSFLIKKLNLKTPGREDDSEETKLYTKADYKAKQAGEAGALSAADELSDQIMKGLGGKKNISDVDCCATRLRVTVHKSELVNDAMLKATGASGVVHKGNGVQVIYGPHVTVIKSNLEDYLETAPNVEYNGAGETVADEAAAQTSAEPTGEVVKTVVLGSPISGVAADLAETPDEVFAQKMMGDGAVVTPNDGKVVAPADGTVVFVFDTKHAIGFKTDDDVAMLLHFGIDTVKLKGEGFNVHVTNGQKVKKGDLLMEADLDYISKNAPSIATPVLCTELKGNQKLRRLADGEIKAGEDLLAVDFYE
jgi:PTS system D-glucosamine-specific IIC component